MKNTCLPSLSVHFALVALLAAPGAQAEPRDGGMSTASPEQACVTYKDLQAARASHPTLAIKIAGIGGAAVAAGAGLWATAHVYDRQLAQVDLAEAGETAVREARLLSLRVMEHFTASELFEQFVKTAESRATVIASREKTLARIHNRTWDMSADLLKTVIRRAVEDDKLAKLLTHNGIPKETAKVLQSAFKKAFERGAGVTNVNALLVVHTTHTEGGKGNFWILKAALKSSLEALGASNMLDALKEQGTKNGSNTMLRLIEAGRTYSRVTGPLAESRKFNSRVKTTGKVALAAGAALDVAAMVLTTTDAKAATLKDSYRENPTQLFDLPEAEACQALARDEVLRERFLFVADATTLQGKAPNRSVDPAENEGPQLSSAFDADLKEMKGNADAQAIQGAFHQIAKEEAAVSGR